MGFESVLQAMGAVPKGSTPKVILEEGGDPGYAQTDPISNMVRGITKFQQEIQEKEEKKQKALKSRADMYKTLRDAGYEPKRAYTSIMENKFPEEAGGESESEKKTKASLLKTEAETENIKKRTDILSSSKKALSEKILAKIADGQVLTPGEQKVYDEVIRKYGEKSSLDSILTNKDEDKVPVLSPQGVPGKVPKSRLQEFLKKGYKLR